MTFSRARVEASTHHLAKVEEGVEGEKHVHKPLAHLAVFVADDAKAGRVGVALGLGALRLLALLKALVPGQVLDSCSRHTSSSAFASVSVYDTTLAKCTNFKRGWRMARQR
eukprot:6171943-Pleurochrysis_carterae.AAC.2